MKNFLSSVFVFIIVVGGGFVFYKYWPYIFARTVEGVISDVQRVSTPVAVVSGGSTTTARDLFSFAVGVREKSGEIVTASSEDRQWAVARRGQCAKAKFYPYPPWEFEKSGTYFGARLLKLHECTTGELVSENSMQQQQTRENQQALPGQEGQPSQADAETAAAAAAAISAEQNPPPASK